MVQAVENRTALSGVVEQVGAAGVTLRVEAAEPVEGYPNLMATTRGESITLALPGSVTPPRPGERIRCLARLAGPQRYVAMPDSME